MLLGQAVSTARPVKAIVNNEGNKLTWSWIKKLLVQTVILTTIAKSNIYNETLLWEIFIFIRVMLLFDS